MSKNKAATIQVQVDVQGAVSTIGEITDAVGIAGELTVEIGSTISDAFSSALDNIGVLVAEIKVLSNSMKSVSKWDLSSVATDLNNISELLDEIAQKLNETDWMGIVSLAMQVFSQGFDIYSYETTRPRGKFESGKYTLFGGKGKYTAKKTNMSGKSTDTIGIVAGGIGLMDSGLAEIIGDITEKFKKSTAATWLQNAAVTA